MKVIQGLLALAPAIVLTHAALRTAQQPLERSATAGSRPHINQELFNSLSQLAHAVDIAYCVSTSGIQSPFECSSWCTSFPNFELVETFNSGALLGDAAGYVALDHSPDDPRIIVAFRGTYNIANTVTDLSTMPQKYVPYVPPGDDTVRTNTQATEVTTSTCTNCTVHAGFLSSWTQVRDVIEPLLTEARLSYPKYSLHLVGHSLGGAVSLLAGLEYEARGWDPIITTFGEPRVGNALFVEHVDSIDWTYRRVTHLDDPVPLLPPTSMGYAAHGSELFISTADTPPNLEQVTECKGNEDPQCSASGSASRIWQLFFAHRDYWTRLGLCVRKDGMSGGLPWENEDEL